MMRFVLSALIAVAALAALAWAHEFAQGDMEIDHPWARPTVTARQPAAVFFTLKNNGDTSDRLVGANVEADIAEAAELHISSVENGLARMRPLADGVGVPAGATVAFEPGGRHVMLFGLTAPLEDGTKFPITLVFETAGEVEVVVNVETQPDTPADAHAGHGS